MTTSVLTWSQSYWGSAAASNTLADSFAALASSLDAADANADFPWQICSSDLASASTRYVTLKRKDASPGRILFACALTSADGQWNTNMQLSTAVPSTAIVVCVREGGTSDTPTGIRGSSAALFTDEVQATSTPITNNVNATVAAGDFWEVAANEDMVLAYQTPSTHIWGTANRVFLAGKILLDPVLDVAVNGALHVAAAAWLPSAINAVSSVGAMTFGPGGVIENWGKITDVDQNFMINKGRDLTNKKIYFPPVQLGCLQTTLGGKDAFKYHLRQISHQVAPVAAREQIDDGVTHYATAMGAVVSGSVTWWLLNFKLNA